MFKALLLAAVTWPLVLGSVVWARQGGARPAWTSVVYLGASFVCHQRPERSFHTGGEAWPVCARCSGLYLSAPFGALAALGWSRRRRAAASHPAPWLAIVAVAALPTAITWSLEWFGLVPFSNLARAVAAAPLGATIAFVILSVVSAGPGPEKTIE